MKYSGLTCRNISTQRDELSVNRNTISKLKTGRGYCAYECIDKIVPFACQIFPNTTIHPITSSAQLSNKQTKKQKNTVDTN